MKIKKFNELVAYHEPDMKELIDSTLENMREIEDILKSEVNLDGDDKKGFYDNVSVLIGNLKYFIIEDRRLKKNKKVKKIKKSNDDHYFVKKIKWDD